MPVPRRDSTRAAALEHARVEGGVEQELPDVLAERGAVVETAAAAHGILFQRPVAGRGFPRIDNPDAGARGREAEDDRQEQRDDEEQAPLDGVLDEEHREAAAESRVAERPGRHQRFPAVRLHSHLPPREEVEHRRPAEDEPESRRS